MDMPRFSPMDDDARNFDDEEFQAGYDARMTDVPLASSATRSWRAGWADADAGLCDMEDELRTQSDEDTLS